jgi:Zn-dependent protease with chaperone function
MDSAARNLATLAAISTVLMAEGICGLIAYVLLPLFSRSHSFCLACLLPTIMLGGLLTASLWLGARGFWRRLSASRRLAHRVHSLAVPSSTALRVGAEATGLAGRVDLVNAEESFSFVYGLVHPRVAISAGLVGRLSPAELRAALEHERYHVRNRDPLRSLIGTVLAEAIFLVPSLAVLQRRYEASRELTADQLAERVCGRRSLAGALLKALEDPLWPDAVASAPLASPDLLSLRLARLESGRMPRLPVGLSDLAWSVVGVGALLASLAAGIAGVGGAPALSHAVATELNPAGGTFEALCLAPVIGLTALATFASARGSRGIIETAEWLNH